MERIRKIYITDETERSILSGGTHDYCYGYKDAYVKNEYVKLDDVIELLEKLNRRCVGLVFDDYTRNV